MASPCLHGDSCAPVNAPDEVINALQPATEIIELIGEREGFKNKYGHFSQASLYLDVECERASSANFLLNKATYVQARGFCFTASASKNF